MTNDAVRTGWAGGGAGWVANEAIFDRAFAPLTEAILQAADLRVGQSMLDVGCGSGTLLVAAVAHGLRATGVDVSTVMAEAARRRVPSATIEVGDAETVDLAAGASAPYDRVVSRFGVMFFANPVAAFDNIRRSTATDGRLVFGCWRGLAENPSFSDGGSLLTDRLPDSSVPGLDPTAPGPMAFADRDRLAQLLTAAGWREVMISPFDFTLDYGEGLAGVEDRLAVILATSSGVRAERILRPTLGESGWAELVDQVRAHLHGQLIDGRVQLPGATWLVTAANGATDRPVLT